MITFVHVMGICNLVICGVYKNPDVEQNILSFELGYCFYWNAHPIFFFLKPYPIFKESAPLYRGIMWQNWKWDIENVNLQNYEH